MSEPVQLKRGKGGIQTKGFEGEMCPKGMGCEYPPRFQLPTLLTQGRGSAFHLLHTGLLWGMDGVSGTH